MSADEQRELEEEEREEEERERRAEILKRRQMRLSAIAEHPEYPELVAEAERYVKLLKTQVAEMVWSGDPIDQRFVDFARGQAAGYLAAVQTPGHAETALLAALEEALEDERQRAKLRQMEEELHYA